MRQTEKTIVEVPGRHSSLPAISFYAAHVAYAYQYSPLRSLSHCRHPLYWTKTIVELLLINSSLLANSSQPVTHGFSIVWASRGYACTSGRRKKPQKLLEEQTCCVLGDNFVVAARQWYLLRGPKQTGKKSSSRTVVWMYNIQIV